MKNAEAQFFVEVTASDEVVCRAPGEPEKRIILADLGAVYVETNDSGPWGADVWWILADKAGIAKVVFPQLATGEEGVIRRLSSLPGFEIKGMNSARTARFLCWSAANPEGER